GEDRVGVVGDALFVLLGFGGALALGEFGHRLFEHFGMRDQVIADDGLDVAALGIGEVLGGRRQWRADQGYREQSGRKKAKRRHRQILKWRVPGQFLLMPPLEQVWRAGAVVVHLGRFGVV